MKILYLYVSKKFFSVFSFTALAFGFIVLISELFRQLSFYMENKTPFLIVIPSRFKYSLVDNTGASRGHSFGSFIFSGGFCKKK